jgi:hypothetical protein
MSSQTEGGDITKMAMAIFDKVRTIKTDHPEIAKTIDGLEKQIKDHMTEIRAQIDRLDEHDRDLVTILVINGLHRAADEILIDS